MSQHRITKPRKCGYCKRTLETTAEQIKRHAENCLANFFKKKAAWLNKIILHSEKSHKGFADESFSELLWDFFFAYGRGIARPIVRGKQIAKK